MPAEDLEKLLASAPLRTLSPAAESELLSKLAGAGIRPHRWWQRPVPLWQAAVACVVLTCSAIGLGRAPSKPGDASAVVPSPSRTSSVTVIIEPAAPLFARPEPRLSPDARHWTVLAATTSGESK